MGRKHVVSPGDATPSTLNPDNAANRLTEPNDFAAQAAGNSRNSRGFLT